MGGFTNFVGFALFGLAARFGQLKMMKTNVFTNMGGTAIVMGSFGLAGVYAGKWEIRAAEIIAEKKAELAEKRRRKIERAEEIAAQKLAAAASE